MTIFNTTKELIKAYENGYNATIFDNKENDNVLQHLKYPIFGDAAQNIKGSGLGKIALPYKLVRKYDKNFASDENQLTGDCFTAGTMVLMADGTLKEIENIEIGDFVLSHYGNKRAVTDIIKKNPSGNKIRNIKLYRYLNNISCTNDHLILTKNNENFEWKRADEITESDYLVIPKNNSYENEYILDMSLFINKESNKRMKQPLVSENHVRYFGSKKVVNRYIKIDEDIGWLIGIFCAEGGISENCRVDFSLNSKEVDIQKNISRIINEKFGLKTFIHDRSHKNVIVVSCSSRLLVEFIKYFVSGNCYTKELHNLNKFNDLSKIEIVRGWIDGDGCFNKSRTRINGVSVSKKLISGISSLLQDLEIQHTVRKRKDRIDRHSSYTIDIYSNEALKLFPECMVSGLIINSSKKQILHKCEFGLLAKVSTNNESDYQDAVYCIEVEEDHSFIANGIAVHNCTSHGCRNATTISLVSDIEERLETEGYAGRLATEIIYGYRGHGGQGMSVARAVNFLSDIGGIALRRKYGKYDLSKYNPQIGINWGRTGVPKSVISEINTNKVLTVSLSRAVDELRDAIYNGYGVVVGSNVGFSSKRDKNGISNPKGSWNHAMCFGGMDDTKTRSSETLFLILNSWADWNSGPKAYDQPDGSFWITATVADKMIRQRQTWVIGNVNGFPAKSVNWGLFDDIL
jgi:intein/homing endonuclease